MVGRSGPGGSAGAGPHPACGAAEDPGGLAVGGRLPGPDPGGAGRVKVLVAGNSQASMLKVAWDRAPAARPAGLELYFHVTPGGQGPYMTVEDGRIAVTAQDPNFPPYAAPPETTGMPLSDFDAVVISALGYVSGGSRFNNPLTTLAAMPDFGPRGALATAELVSPACYAEMLQAGLADQHGLRFLRALGAGYDGTIVVQPFPYPSDALVGLAEWDMTRNYADPLGAHRVLQGARDAALETLCAAAGATLMPCPDPAWRAAGLTPADLMRDTDHVHPTLRHGALVLEQIAATLGA